MAASPSSLSSENEVKKIHPYQCDTKPGPKGAYEARQTKDGLYVRVDMPGVPPDGVKLFKYGENHKVTFTGKAPKHWSCDTSERVYGGYVVLNRDPNELDIEMTVKSGCLRLFFPNAEGTLHFLCPNNFAQHEFGHDPGLMVYGDTEVCCHDQFVQLPEDTTGLRRMRFHSRQCACCNHNGINSSAGESSGTYTLAFSHINPYLLHGVEGIEENKLVVDESGERLYLRVDLPGLEADKCILAVKDSNSVFYGGEGQKEHHLDEGGRIYLGNGMLLCSCCKVVDVQHEMMNGVLRILIQKVNMRSFFRSLSLKERARRLER